MEKIAQGCGSHAQGDREGGGHAEEPLVLDLFQDCFSISSFKKQNNI